MGVGVLRAGHVDEGMTRAESLRGRSRGREWRDRGLGVRDLSLAVVDVIQERSVGRARGTESDVFKLKSGRKKCEVTQYRAIWGKMSKRNDDEGQAVWVGTSRERKRPRRLFARR